MRTIYLNPYRLVEQIIGEAPTQEGGSLDHSQRKALVEFGFHETPALELGGMTVTRAQAQAAFKELRDPEKRRVHWLVYQCPALLDFLTQGRIDGLLAESTPSALEDKGVCRLVGPIFADAYGRVLLEAYHQGEPQRVEECLRLRRFLLSEHEDRSYMPLYGAVRRDAEAMIEDVRRRYLGGDERDSEPAANGCVSPQVGLESDELGDLEDCVQFLNILPAYFQGLRNDTGLALNDVAAEMARRQMAFGCWYALLEVAFSLRLDGEAATRVNWSLTSNSLREKQEEWEVECENSQSCILGYVLGAIIVLVLIVLYAKFGGTAGFLRSQDPAREFDKLTYPLRFNRPIPDGRHGP